ncbi:MAG: hypothetical protein DME59_18830, partial [Verrucomicrobia bacterium]
PAENFINPIAIAAVFDALDCPQNEHYCTTAHDRRYENVFGDRMAHYHKGFRVHGGKTKLLVIINTYSQFLQGNLFLFCLPSFGLLPPGLGR